MIPLADDNPEILDIVGEQPSSGWSWRTAHGPRSRTRTSWRTRCSTSPSTPATRGGRRRADRADGLSVSDAGAGRTEEVRKAAFEPFFTTRPVGAGSGLGLSRIHGFVQPSRGRITLEGRLGAGTTVTLLLCRARRQAPAGWHAAVAA